MQMKNAVYGNWLLTWIACFAINRLKMEKEVKLTEYTVIFFTKTRTPFFLNRTNTTPLYWSYANDHRCPQNRTKLYYLVQKLICKLLQEMWTDTYRFYEGKKHATAGPENKPTNSFYNVTKAIRLTQHRHCSRGCAAHVQGCTLQCFCDKRTNHPPTISVGSQCTAVRYVVPVY